MRVLTWLGGRWRAEQHPTGWRLFEWGGLRLSRATLDEMTRFLLEQGVDPVDDLDS